MKALRKELTGEELVLSSTLYQLLPQKLILRLQQPDVMKKDRIEKILIQNIKHRSYRT